MPLPRLSGCLDKPAGLWSQTCYCQLIARTTTPPPRRETAMPKASKADKADKAKQLRKAPLKTPSSLGENARRDISAELNALLADVFALYLKTKNFHWHMSGPHFRDYHLLLDEQSEEIYATTDPIAERVRKL